MNEHKYLILIKGEDKTNNVRTVKYFEGKQNVTFTSGKTYQYSYNNVEFIKCSKVIDVRSYDVKVSRTYYYNVEKVIVFDMFAKVFFNNGSTRLTKYSNIKLSKKGNGYKSGDVFQYLKDVSEILRMKDDDDRSFLASQFDQLDYIEELSVLQDYLDPNGFISERLSKNVILPFGFNLSQERAVRNAINNKISIIEGPPGTGKTQTILNIIANILMNNQSVAVVSNNNSATSNVQEKLEKYGFGDLSAFLGSKANVLKFISNQNFEYSSDDSWKMTNGKSKKLETDLDDSIEELLELNTLNNERAEVISNQSDIEVEYRHYCNKSKYNRITYDSRILKRSAEDIYDIKEFISSQNNSLINRLKVMFKYQLSLKKLFFGSLDETLERFDHLYYRKNIIEHETRKRELNKILENKDFRELTNSFQYKSLSLLKSVVYDKYSSSKRKYYDEVDMFRDFSGFMKDYPVVLSTTHSLSKTTKGNFQYDYIIVDEASQVDLVSGSLAMSLGKKLVIVGDSKQLPHVVTNEQRKSAVEIMENYNISKNYNFDLSLLDSIKRVFGHNVPTTLLREHYRCDPNIIDFCNKKFYNSELIIHTEKSSENPLEVFLSVEGNHARGRFNQREIDIISKEVLPTLKSDSSLGIITPFRDQANQIEFQLGSKNIESDTVHKYQGREKDIIIMSTVSNSIEKGSFVDDENLLNVAVSRAIDKLILITNSEMLSKKGTNISDLVSYIKYKNFDVKESETVSVFDALYKRHSKKIQEEYKNPRRVSEFKSENIVYELIKDVLSTLNLDSYSMLLHYPLSKLVVEYSRLSDREQEYANNRLTHVDFLIYDKVNKRPVLVIEVDGYAYHNQDSIQMKRDELKNSILRKSGIQLLRLNTTGSSEREKLLQVLDN